MAGAWNSQAAVSGTGKHGVSGPKNVTFARLPVNREAVLRRTVQAICDITGMQYQGYQVAQSLHVGEATMCSQAYEEAGVLNP